VTSGVSAHLQYDNAPRPHQFVEERRNMDPLFEVHMLNEEGKRNAQDIAIKFEILLLDLEKVCGDPPNREWSVVKTKLEEACFFAKKAMANKPRNQAPSQAASAS